jgi:hypothetical protein
MKPKPTFAQTYPYLAYWIESHGYMQLGTDDDSPMDAFLVLNDAGGTCYQDEGSDNIEEALAAAEAYLREIEFPERFDQETIDELEADYARFKLS